MTTAVIHQVWLSLSYPTMMETIHRLQKNRRLTKIITDGDSKERELIPVKNQKDIGNDENEHKDGNLKDSNQQSDSELSNHSDAGSPRNSAKARNGSKSGGVSTGSQTHIPQGMSLSDLQTFKPTKGER